MLNSKKANFVFALILAIALWMYVVGELNPTIKKTYRNIPVTLINEQTLNDNGLAIKDASDDKMRITVSGKRDSVSSLSKTDIVATVDLAECAEGQNKLSINIKVPEDIEIDNQSLDEVTVSCEIVVTREKNVRVRYSGNAEEGYEPTTVKLDPEKVEVKGAKSLVDNVAYILCDVDSEDISNELTSTSNAIRAVDKNGRQIDNITLSVETCKVTAILYETKEVRLSVRMKGRGANGKKRSASSVSLIVKGPESSLVDIKTIDTKVIDVSKISKTQEIEVTPVLPEDVQLSDKNSKVTCEIIVK